MARRTFSPLLLFLLHLQLQLQILTLAHLASALRPSDTKHRTDSVYITPITYKNHPPLVRTAPIACPCSFTIKTPVGAPPLDFIITQPINSQHPAPTISVNESESRYGQMLRDARYTTRYKVHHVLTVRKSITAFLTVRHSNPINAQTMSNHDVQITSSDITQTIATTTNANIHRQSCPIVLSPQQPLRTSISKPTSTNVNTLLNRSTTSLQSMERQPRIVGGERVNTDLQDYLVYIETRSQNRIRICSGTLIAPTLLITAAHCELIPGLSRAYIGFATGRSTSDSQSARRFIRSFHPDQKYFSLETLSTEQNWFDFAFATLNEPAPPEARFMKVNVNASIPVPGSFVRTAGYGDLVFNSSGSNPDRVLNQVDVPVVGKSECRTAYADIEPINNKMQVCAGYINRGGCDSW